MTGALVTIRLELNGPQDPMASYTPCCAVGFSTDLALNRDYFAVNRSGKMLYGEDEMDYELSRAFTDYEAGYPQIWNMYYFQVDNEMFPEKGVVRRERVTFDANLPPGITVEDVHNLAVLCMKEERPITLVSKKATPGELAGAIKHALTHPGGGAPSA